MRPPVNSPVRFEKHAATARSNCTNGRRKIWGAVGGHFDESRYDPIGYVEWRLLSSASTLSHMRCIGDAAIFRLYSADPFGARLNRDPVYRAVPELYASYRGCHPGHCLELLISQNEKWKSPKEASQRLPFKV